MKILDFNHFKPLENALNKMGTNPNVEYSHSGSWKHISREELKLLNTRGIELSIEQLENWSKKIDVKIIKSETGSDPASVAFKALEFAIKNNFDYVLIDTAGRLQNKKNLMEEYKKISNVTKKIDPNSPHEVLLVLDATTGQNALIQVEEFQKIAPITGIIMTKLDGTAKGGILIALAKKFNLPIIALGLGEKEDDLQIFNSKDFAKALINTN